MSEPSTSLSVLTHRDGRVGQVTLNRPEALNAITPELARALERSLAELANEVDVIVLRGAGGNFSVGGDFKELERLRAQGPEAMAELFEAFGSACRLIGELPVPVIAAVEGYALAGGFELMQACDFAVVRDDARIGDHHSNFGQVPGGGSSQRLPRLVGRQRALALLLTGDHLSGAEAAAWGLAYRAVPPAEFDAAVEELAERLAAKSREALARIKALVREGLERPLAEGLAHELEVVLEHLSEGSGGEGIERFAAREAEGAAEMGEALIDSGPVRLELEDGVARLRLNRPKVANAMNLELLRAFREAAMKCESDGRVRAVLLTGEGPNFCAGGDVREFAAQGDGLPDYLREATALLHGATSTLMRLEAPVVAVVQGFAAGGGGFGLVCASDLVLAGKSARFMQGAAPVGMVPDAGATITLPRLVGHRRALEITLTNRILSAAEALELGLITRVVPDKSLLDEGLALARELATGPTRALAATKRLIWDGAGSSLEQCLLEEARTQVEMGGTEDAHEGLAAVIERRPPRFKGR